MKKLGSSKRALYRCIDFISSLFLARADPNSAARVSSLDPKRILLVEFYGIGDLVLMSEALDPLKQEWPDAEVWIVGSSFAKHLYAHDQRVHEVMVLDVPWILKGSRYNVFKWPWRALRGLVSTLRALDFDIAFGRPDVPMNILLYASRAKVRLGYDVPGGSRLLTHRLRNEQKSTDYEGMVWRGYLEALGINSSEVRTQLIPNGDYDEEVRGILGSFSGAVGNRPLVGIHAGASDMLKCWPLDRFRYLAETLSEQARIIWFVDHLHFSSGLDDNDRVIEVSANFPVFMNLLAECELLVCNDSGPMHLAAALGTHTVAIFRPEIVERFAPRKACTAVVDDERPERPGGARFATRDIACIEKITVDDVLEAVLRHLEHGAS